MIYSPEGVVLLAADQIRGFVDRASEPKLTLDERLLALARAFTPLVSLDREDKLSDGPLVPAKIRRGQPFYIIRNTQPPDELRGEAIFVYHARGMTGSRRHGDRPGFYAVESTESAGFDNILASVGRVVMGVIVDEQPVRSQQY